LLGSLAVHGQRRWRTRRKGQPWQHGFLNGKVAENRCVSRAQVPGHVLKEWTLSLNRNEKAAVVAEVAGQVARSQTLALAEYRGLTVADLDKLRRIARDQVCIFTC